MKIKIDDAFMKAGIATLIKHIPAGTTKITKGLTRHLVENFVVPFTRADIETGKHAIGLRVVGQNQPQ